MIPLYPMVFSVETVEASWGGHLFSQTFPLSNVASERGGIYYLLVDDVSVSSRVENGALVGKTLHDLVQINDLSLWGKEELSEYFPLEFSIVDLGLPLPPTVYPDPQKLNLFEGAVPCTQFWHLLACQPHATISVGIERNIPQYEFSEAVREHRQIHALLMNSEAVAGDSYLIPSGRVHALSEGVLFLSVQQRGGTPLDLASPSDTTREIGLKALNFTERNSCCIPAPRNTPAFNRRTPLADHCQFFSFDLLELVSDYQEQTSIEKGAHILISFTAPILIVTSTGEEVQVPEAQVVFIPAGLGHYTIKVSQYTRVIKAIPYYG